MTSFQPILCCKKREESHVVESGKYDLNSNSDTEKDDLNKPDIQNGESQSLLKKDNPATTTSKNDPIVIVSKGCILSNYKLNKP